MGKTLIYSCVFFNENYVELLRLLLKSYVLFGNPRKDIDYLVICNPDFKENVDKVFREIAIEGKIWDLDLKTLFEAGYSRLFIFDYPNINEYDKILYLDCDILVSNNISNLVDFELENKIYALKEGNTNHPYWGSQFFPDGHNVEAYSSGILLFNNNVIIKQLFKTILDHIHRHKEQGLPIPDCLDQPFIVYHSITQQLYNNEKLIEFCLNNPDRVGCQGETILHFPGGPGSYDSKIMRMSWFLVYELLALRYNCSYDNLVKVNDYKKLVNDNKKHFDRLLEICKEIGEEVEGNCFTEHLNIDHKIDALIYKQMNHYSLGAAANNIMEIGFNAGHSSLLYLLANPNSRLTIFDICDHKYTVPCFKYLQSIFPNRLQLFIGDSTETVPEFHSRYPDVKFDLIHIDGAHFGDIPNKDFFNSFEMASDVIIWDDTQIDTLNNLFNSYLRNGLVNELFLYDTQVYKHRICTVKRNQDNLLHKTFNWEGSNITFLGNSRMIAFGEGSYSYINKQLVRCYFGGRQHLLKFNDDFSSFTSVRTDDFSVVNGKVCENNIVLEK